MEFTKIQIDSNILDKYNLTLEEFLYLYLFKLRKNDCFIETITESLLKKGYLTKIYTTFVNENPIKLFNKGTEVIDFILNESEKSSIEEDLTQIAEQLKLLFPKGNKSPGHPWRSNTREIVNKLKKFKKLYPYSNEEILSATKHYVDNMENNMYMRTLKYFILKRNEEGEEVSDLASYIESFDEEEIKDWVLQLKTSK